MRPATRGTARIQHEVRATLPEELGDGALHEAPRQGEAHPLAIPRPTAITRIVPTRAVPARAEPARILTAQILPARILHAQILHAQSIPPLSLRLAEGDAPRETV